MKIIAIAAGKGGVGKSTVAVNCALSLQQLGFRVGLLDADIYGPSLATMLPVDLWPKEIEGKLTPAYAKGLAFISFSLFRKEAAAVRAPVVNGIIEQFLTDVIWGELDFLIVDFPPGTGDIQLTLMQKASFSGALLVTTPQKISQLDVEKAADMFTRMDVPLLGVVENMSHWVDRPELTPFGKGAGENLAQLYRIPLLAQIPLDPHIARCCDEGLSLFEAPTPVAGLFLDVASSLCDALGKREKEEIALIPVSPTEMKLHINGRAIRSFSAVELQARCPCRRCESARPSIDPDVEILSIQKVGSYALSLRFSSGCSLGLFPLKSLNMRTAS